MVFNSTQEDEDKAVSRMSNTRQQTINLLSLTGREGIDNVLEYLDDSGFYYRASSTRSHHNFPGGLAEHSLGTYKIANNPTSAKEVDKDSLIIGTILHDICKPERGVVLFFPKLDNKASLVDPANGSSNSSFRGLFKGILKSGKI